ncbi:protein of unknown function [Paenibacillus alvei]|uniref:Uncharacterized protein n=1 Tax=Paenibacillus alvei TaxID=44250 RepID=A0A383R8T8_PAEAL|nr:protein of unknown function [Paenibacillus alvei]
MVTLANTIFMLSLSLGSQKDTVESAHNLARLSLFDTVAFAPLRFSGS